MVYTCKVEQPALLKVLAHAAKHPAYGVNGVLLGECSSDGAHVQDVVPLCHSCLTLAPAIEVGLAQAEGYAQQSGLSIVGYYHSDARFAASDVPPVGRKVADRIAEKQPGSAVLVLDNKKLEQFCKAAAENPFELFSKDGAKGWKRESPDLIAVSGEWKQLREDFFLMFKQQRHKDLMDFEDHLDDAHKDYTNKAFTPVAKFALPGNVM